MQARFIPKKFTWNKDYPSYENCSIHLVHFHCHRQKTYLVYLFHLRENNISNFLFPFLLLSMTDNKIYATNFFWHINIRYFFVKDRIAKGEIKIEYCPTKLMVADILTKPVQGRLFLELRDLLLGYKV